MASMTTVDGVDPSALRLFLAAVELGSVSKAAARVHLSQPSATTKLHKLERLLGTTLLERTPTGSVPTPAGARLAPACAEALGAATALVDHAERIRDEVDVLTIAATRHVADHFLPTWVARLPAGSARVDLLELDTLRVAQAVRGGEAVVGFTEGPQAPLGLRSQVVASEAVLPVVGRDHPWFGRRTALAPSDVIASSLVLGEPGSGTRDIVEAAFAEREWGLVGERIDVANASAARLAALHGSGIAFLPSCWVHGHLVSGDLFALPVRHLTIEQAVRVVWRGARPATAAARNLVAALPTGQ